MVGQDQACEPETLRRLPKRDEPEAAQPPGQPCAGAPRQGPRSLDLPPAAEEQRQMQLIRQCLGEAGIVPGRLAAHFVVHVHDHQLHIPLANFSPMQEVKQGHAVSAAAHADPPPPGGHLLDRTAHA